MNMNAQLVIALILLVNVSNVISFNKYSKEANTPEKGTNYKSLDKPFRMQKLNLLWEKAKQKVSEQKLKNLYTDLKLQDKEELNLKTIKASGKDKDGLQEAIIRRTLNAITTKYGLTDYFKVEEDNQIIKDEIYSSPSDAHLNKLLFRDKKLNKLWHKAESVGFTDEEMKILKEEFQHHQEKINQYHQLMNEVNEKSLSNSKDDRENSIEFLLEGEEGEIPKYKTTSNNHQLLKEKHIQLKKGYDNLAEQIVKGVKKEIFEEPHVQKLWQMAQKADFTTEELDSLKEELHHLEHRVKKLKYLEADLEFSLERHQSDELSDGLKLKEKRVKDFNHKVSKVHSELEGRIMQRHLEL